jgi:hypothetical protein
MQLKGLKQVGSDHRIPNYGSKHALIHCHCVHNHNNGMPAWGCHPGKKVLVNAEKKAPKAPK